MTEGGRARGPKSEPGMTEVGREPGQSPRTRPITVIPDLIRDLTTDNRTVTAQAWASGAFLVKTRYCRANGNRWTNRDGRAVRMSTTTVKVISLSSGSEIRP